MQKYSGMISIIIKCITMLLFRLVIRPEEKEKKEAKILNYD